MYNIYYRIIPDLDYCTCKFKKCVHLSKIKDQNKTKDGVKLKIIYRNYNITLDIAMNIFTYL